jgi:hypothetical protein
MTTTWRAHDDAIAEIEATVAWYERQRPGLGAEFLVELREDLVELRLAPMASVRDAFSSTGLPIRRRRLRRFPYAIIFVERPGEFVVLAVMHLRRRPGYWLSRVQDE